MNRRSVLGWCLSLLGIPPLGKLEAAPAKAANESHSCRKSLVGTLVKPEGSGTITLTLEGSHEALHSFWMCYSNRISPIWHGPDDVLNFGNYQHAYFFDELKKSGGKSLTVHAAHGGSFVGGSLLSHREILMHCVGEFGVLVSNWDENY